MSFELVQSPPTYYGAWFDTHGNGADFVCNVIAHRGLADPDGCKITVQTKNSEDSDDLAVDLVMTALTLTGTVPPLNVNFSAGAQVGSSAAGFKELARSLRHGMSSPRSVRFHPAQSEEASMKQWLHLRFFGLTSAKLNSTELNSSRDASS